jgi:hypothetical protein
MLRGRLRSASSLQLHALTLQSDWTVILLAPGTLPACSRMPRLP